MRIGRVSSGMNLWRQVLAIFLIINTKNIILAAESDENGTAANVKDPNEINGKKDDSSKGYKLISLAESIRKSQKMFEEERLEILRNYWKDTFREIKDLTVVRRSKNGQNQPKDTLLTEWKLLSEEEGEDSEVDSQQQSSLAETSPRKRRRRPKRFDGFASWDRLLQQWADDVADYLEERQVESGEYPLSTFGIPSVEGKAVDEEGEGNREASNADHSVVTHGAPTGKRQQVDILPQVELVDKPLLPTPKPVEPRQEVVPHTNIADKSKKVWIVTTAALPWMTGTAVNPLLRASYMTEGRQEAGGNVTLMLPWLERKDDQERVYGKDRVFETPEDQENYIRRWLRESASMKEASEVLGIAWYPARQEVAENSVYSMGDITALVPAEQVDICILEEPEHLNWYRAPGESWTTKFKHVVGIIHTNYFVYAQEQPGALIRAPAIRLLCSWMCRAHCHRVIKLSGTLGKFAPEKELVENVHGVRGTFLDIGAEVRERLTSGDVENDPVFGANAEPSIYFIGKMLWSKGLGSLMELLKYTEECADLRLAVDMYGGGPDKDAAEAKSLKLGLDMPFHGPVDHSKLAMTHKIFVNPSTSEVLCTTVSEALAMGKFVVLPSHPSNDFFAQFPNCLPYSNKEEFVGNLYYALTHAPEPLTEEYAYVLSWKAATKRLEAAGSISVDEAKAIEEANVEIDLPPLIESEQRRRRLATTIRKSRHRYRQFRSRLSEEVKQSKVLPKDLRDRLTTELDKRLDLDIDTVLESPKLRLQLSPAELDKRLLDLYDTLSASASGDALRVIGGGANVGMQNLYMKQQAQKERRRQQRRGLVMPPSLNFPQLVSLDETADDEIERTPAQWVQLAIRRNANNIKGPIQKTSKINESKRNKNNMEMCFGGSHRQSQQSLMIPTNTRCFLTNSVRRTKVYTPLI